MSGERRIVYVLGAGASYGAGAYAAKQGGGRIPIPTQTTFWETFLRFCRSSENRRRIEHFLYRYFSDYDRVTSRSTAAARRRQLAPIDVEEVFTFLSERNFAPSISPQLKTYTLWKNNYGTTVPPLSGSRRRLGLVAMEARLYSKIRLNTDGWHWGSFSTAAWRLR